MEDVKINKKCAMDGLISLYYLIIAADGVISPKEIEMGEIMMEYEGIDRVEFEEKIEHFKSMDQKQLLTECLHSLADYDMDTKIRIVAWMAHIANSDGFMDPSEWALIYKVYHKALNLDLKKIMEVTKTLPRA